MKQVGFQVFKSLSQCSRAQEVNGKVGLEGWEEKDVDCPRASQLFGCAGPNLQLLAVVLSLQPLPCSLLCLGRGKVERLNYY